MEQSDKWDRRFLEMAKLIASWSKDPSTQAGAVITDNKRRVISMGYNGLAQGVEDLPERLNNREIKYKMFVHAERNAIIFARQSLENCSIYIWPFMTCAACAAMVIQTGIKRVVAPHSLNERWIYDFELATHQYREAGVELCLLDKPEVPPTTENK